MTDANALSDYLGDGVHAQFIPSRNQICLMVERATPAAQVTPNVRIERVCLEPETFQALQRFAALCWPPEVQHDSAA